jgi:ribosome modulation factor
MRTMEQDPNRPSAAFIEGYDTGRTGGPRTDNLHKSDSAEAEQWLEGWDEGSAKREYQISERSVGAPRASSQTEEPAMSGMQGEALEPGERGEQAASKGRPANANPYAAGSAEAEEWLDGHHYATSIGVDEPLPIGQEPKIHEMKSFQVYRPRLMRHL